MSEEKQAIVKNINEGHRERLKLRFDQAGFDGFAEHEILEMMLFFAIPRRDTKPIAKLLLNEFKDLNGVISATSHQLKKIKGIGKESARFLTCLREFCSYINRTSALREEAEITGSSALIQYLRTKMTRLIHEEFRILYLNIKNIIIKDEVLSEGTESQTAVYPKKIVKRALELGASGIIVAHNHPAGSLKPSRADILVTRKIKEAAEPLDILLLDHVIIGGSGEGFFSFRQNGLI
ncbi:MAG: DNA repair protein RadC [Candidatus Riflebacteria bacterium]|nr:DNA repair protein RadC [Candidatus Riflebacteria bacterium]